MSFAYPRGQCTWLCGQLCPWLPNADLGNARDWANNGRVHGLVLSNTPSLGAIAVLAPGVDGADSAYGHVAIVCQVAGDNVTVLSANWSAGASPGSLDGVPLTFQQHRQQSGIVYLSPTAPAAATAVPYVESHGIGSDAAAVRGCIPWYDSVHYSSWLILAPADGSAGNATVTGAGLSEAVSWPAGATGIIRPAAYLGPLYWSASCPVVVAVRSVVA